MDVQVQDSKSAGSNSMGFDSPSRHRLKYQYHLWNQRLAALVRALYLECFPVDPALTYELRYSAHPLYLQYLGFVCSGLYFCWFLLFTLDYGMRSGLGFKAWVPCPCFLFSGTGSQRNKVALYGDWAYAVQNPLQRAFGQKKIEVFFFSLARLRRRCFADAAMLVGIVLLKPETPYTAA